MLAQILVGVSLAGALSGCAQQYVSLEQGPREYVATDYEAILKRWTREEQLILVNELDDVFLATATYESWDFRWAYVVRYADDYRLTIDQRSAMLDRALLESETYHQFYVAVHASRFKWGDLTREEPAWIVRMIDDLGTETAPIEIDLINKPGPTELRYFPYTTPWRVIHRVRFPVARKDGTRTISPNAKWFGLRFAGPQGNKNLVWQLRKTKNPD
jgi:hypothetical protein